MEVGLVEDDLNMFRVAVLQLPLQVTTPMLVLAESVDFALKMLKRNIVELSLV